MLEKTKGEKKDAIVKIGEKREKERKRERETERKRKNANNPSLKKR